MKFNIKKFLSNANILVVLMCIYIIFTTIFLFSTNPGVEVKKLIVSIDTMLSPIILIYFIVSLVRAKDKKKFMRWGWILLIAALPPIGILHKAWDYLQILRLLIIVQFFYNNKHETKNTITNNLINSIMVAVFIVLISTILVLHFENAPNSNIKTAGEAVYWAIVTISTVGYGDFYPVTTPGRIVTCFLIFSGVSIFVSAAGAFITWIGQLNHPKKTEKESDSQTPTQ